MSWVLKNSEARLGQRLVLLVLADHAKEDGSSSWPSIATIASEARLSESQVKRCLRELLGSKSIVKTGISKHGTHIYEVAMDEEARKASIDARRGAQIAPQGGANTTGEGGANTTEGGRILRPEPSLKQPSFEKQPSKDLERASAGGNQVAVIVARKNRSVDRQIVTSEEDALAREVLLAWNELASQSLSSQDWLNKIILRAREHPELTLVDHQFVIDQNLKDPWWKGPANPSVIYGSGAQFERSMLAAGSANRNGSQGAFEIALAELRRMEQESTR